MNQEENNKIYNDYFVRPKEKITTSKEREYKVCIAPFSTDIEYRQLQELFSNCFDHHVKSSVDANPDTFMICKDTKRKILFTDNLTSIFLKSYYIKPDLYMTDSEDEETMNDQLVDYYEFKKLITDNPISVDNFGNSDIGSNFVHYLIGNVGVGKSVLAAKIVKDINDDNKKRDNIIIPVHFDLEDRGFIGKKGKLCDIDNLFYKELFYYTQHVIQSNKQYDDKADLLKHFPNPDNHESATFCIKSLSAHLAERNIRLLYIFDNLDRYHFHDTRYTFFEEGYSKRRASIENDIGGLINTFSFKNPILGNSGLCVVFVCRRHVYHDSRNLDATSPVNDRSHVFQLKPATAAEVINKRHEFLCDAISFLRDKIPAKFRDFNKGLDYLTLLFELREDNKGKFDFKQPILEAIASLSHHGYRGLVGFLTTLKLNYQDIDITERLLDNQLIMLILLYMNNVQTRYTQFNNHFPNMFLNDCVVSYNPTFARAHEPHMHTYWIKYFLLKYISKKNNVTADEIVQLFVGENKYEENFVLHVLGSLCTTNEFSCVEIDYTSTHKDFMKYILTSTNRGNFMMSPQDNLFSSNPYTRNKVDFCFRFIYLELVVDDYLLSIPKQFINSIYIEDDNYKHLFMGFEKYGKRSLLHIQRKSKAVIHFLKVLFVALEVEREKKDGLYESLSQMQLIPDEKVVISSIKHELKILCTKMDILPFYNHEIDGLWPKLSKDKSYEKFFRDYFESGIKVA